MFYLILHLLYKQLVVNSYFVFFYDVIDIVP